MNIFEGGWGSHKEEDKNKQPASLPVTEQTGDSTATNIGYQNKVWEDASTQVTEQESIPAFTFAVGTEADRQIAQDSQNKIDREKTQAEKLEREQQEKFDAIKIGDTVHLKDGGQEPVFGKRDGMIIVGTEAMNYAVSLDRIIDHF